MSNTGAGYTSFFTSIAAGDINVFGLPAGSAGALGIPAPGRSSYAARFAISPDVDALVRSVRRFVPARPASYTEGFAPELLAAD